jgi:hypothetical protein
LAEDNLLLSLLSMLGEEWERTDKNRRLFSTNPG